jgi:hypothetical protein
MAPPDLSRGWTCGPHQQPDAEENGYQSCHMLPVMTAAVTSTIAMRRAGVDPLTSMQITGHKTMVCFTRYNSFREADLRAAAEKSDTYRTLAHLKAAQEAVECVAKKIATA